MIMKKGQRCNINATEDRERESGAKERGQFLENGKCEKRILFYSFQEGTQLGCQCDFSPMGPMLVF